MPGRRTDQPGVLLDRVDRKRVMIASDLVRAVVALGFILCIHQQSTGLLYLLSRHSDAQFASPFFTSGRSSSSARHRHARRAAHGQHHDANHVVGRHHHRRVPRRGRHGWRLPGGVSVQRALVSDLRLLHLAAQTPRRLPRQNGREAGERIRPLPIPRGPWLHARHSAGGGRRHAQRRMGFGRRRGTNPLQPVWRKGFQPRRVGHRHHLGLGPESAC